MRFGNTRLVRRAPAVTASAYTAGYSLGGVQAIGPFSTPFSRGVLKTVTVVDKGNQKPALTILLIQGVPVGTYTDHAAPTNVANDAAAILGKVEIATSDWTTVGGVAVASVDVSKAVVGSDPDKVVSAVAVVGGTPTPASAADYEFVYGFLAD